MFYYKSSNNHILSWSKVGFITKKSSDFIVHFYHMLIHFNFFSIQYLNSGAGGLAGAFVHEKHAHTIKPA